CGEVSERLKEPASKAGSLAKPGSWVQIPPSPPWLPTFYLRWNLASVGNLGLALYAPHARRGSSNPTLSAMVAHLSLTLEFSVGREPGTCFVCAACAARLVKSHPLRHRCPPFTTLEFSVGREPGTCFVCAACAARRAHQIPTSPPWLPTFYLRWNLASVGNLGLALYAPHARRGGLVKSHPLRHL